MSRDGLGLFKNKNTPKKRCYWLFRYKDAQGNWKTKSTQTTDKQEAKDFKDRFIKELESPAPLVPVVDVPVIAIPAAPNDNEMAEWTLSKAVDSWIAYREVTKATKTHKNEGVFLRRIISIIGESRKLGSLTVHDLQNYQVTRLKQKGQMTKKAIHPRTVNLELKALRQVLNHADLWERFKKKYKPLSVPPTTVGRVLIPEQAKKLFDVAQTNKKWQVAFYCFALAHGTGLRSLEIKHLRVGDIQLQGDNPHLRVRRSKTAAGYRTVPMNAGACWAASWLLERAKVLGAVKDEHFLLPINRSCHHRDYDPMKGKMTGYDPTAHQNNFTKSWGKLRDAAGLAGFRVHDARHSFITALAETNAPIAVAMSLAGHRSQTVHSVYQHVQTGPKQQAVLALVQMFPALEAHT
jgi:integrase